MVSQSCRAFTEVPDPTRAFSFLLEERIECSSSHHVRYTESEENALTIPIPIEKAYNKGFIPNLSLRNFHLYTYIKKKKHNKRITSLVAAADLMLVSLF